ncbi:hypothetical protein ACKKBG_A30230 [Auxenochlorella protothecoides x Auxenochlorella symbiontica]
MSLASTVLQAAACPLKVQTSWIPSRRPRMAARMGSRDGGPAASRLEAPTTAKQSHRSSEEGRPSTSADAGASSGNGSSSGTPEHLEDTESGTEAEAEEFKSNAAILAAVGLVSVAGAGFYFKDQIWVSLEWFTGVIDAMGPEGYLVYVAAYALLELVAVPAIPLTVAAGALFGLWPGVATVSLAASIASTTAFLIARYLARDRVSAMASKNKQFAAIDRAIGKDSLRVVTLLRLSPLLPFSASNYLYGLTSVDVGSYMLGSWIGMLPGTFAYVSVGAYGKDLASGHGVAPWQVALGLGATAATIWYVGGLASKALADVEEEEESGKKEKKA